MFYLVILVCRLAGVKLARIWVVGIASLVFTGLFLFFLTGFGPFVDRKEIREYRMAWTIQPPASKPSPRWSSHSLSFPGILSAIILKNWRDIFRRLARTR